MLVECDGTARHSVTFTLDGKTKQEGKVCDEHHRVISAGATVGLSLAPALPDRYLR